MDETQLQLATYVSKASEMAEALRHDIQHNNGVVTNKTILALNDFVIAANNIKDLTDIIENDTIKLN